ncbi:MAG: FAD-binding oxidoreductase [Deltaproteobacteria bacterium]|nr:FAD-binding oxidoreductase [Deltaproteobacteria bacterium]
MTMRPHDQKIERIAEQLKKRKKSNPVSLRKKTVSHEVPKPGDKRRQDEKIDISDLDAILEIDPVDRVCIAEPGVTFVDLVKATLKYGLVPFTVPELKTITIGGAVAGCSIESMSYKYGGFHDSCMEYEIITAEGEILHCTPKNKNQLIFEMVHGTFGTLGIISQLTFKLTPAEPFVRVKYEKYSNMKDYQKAIWGHFKKQDVDFMDGIIHSPQEYVLSLAYFTNQAPYTNNYNWTKVYFQSTATRQEDFLKTPDYFFRYDKGLTHVRPKSFLGRLLFRKFQSSTASLQFAQKFHRWIPPKAIPFTLDTFIPFSRSSDFLKWYEKKIGHFPLWCVPYKTRHYQWVAQDYFNEAQEPLFLDIAIYGLKKRNGTHYHEIIEDELLKIGGLETLIAGNYYREEDFWKIWNKDNYDRVKKHTDPNNIFRDLYTKTRKTMLGLEK